MAQNQAIISLFYFLPSVSTLLQIPDITVDSFAHLDTAWCVMEPPVSNTLNQSLERKSEQETIPALERLTSRSLYWAAWSAVTEAQSKAAGIEESSAVACTLCDQARNLIHRILHMKIFYDRHSMCEETEAQKGEITYLSLSDRKAGMFIPLHWTFLSPHSSTSLPSIFPAAFLSQMFPAGETSDTGPQSGRKKLELLYVFEDNYLLQDSHSIK